MKKVENVVKWYFYQFLDMRSTQKLVKVHNTLNVMKRRKKNEKAKVYKL